MVGTIWACSERLARFWRSRLSWRIVMGLFLLEALWFVCSARYPMAFDENYHFGLIQLHAQQWLPFFTTQPNNASAYGAIVRDPSYLYHWLMSFPYRLISLCTHNLVAQVIFLRLINVGLFASGIVLYRRVIRQLGVSAGLSNSLFAVFILIPVVPFLAAHINYDNLLFVAMPLTALLALRLVGHLKAKRVDAATVLALFVVLLLSSLVKYAFLPVLAITVLFLLWRLWCGRLLGSKGVRSFVDSLRELSHLRQALLLVACLLSVGLFAERYAANTVQYHNPVPACDVVISQDECSQYGPYGRDRTLASQKPDTFHANPLVYVGQWLYGMWYRLFFAINYDYATAPPLVVISVLSILLAMLLVVGVVIRFRRVFEERPERQLVLWLIIGYILVLFTDGFRAYAKTGQPVAINGRYLIPLLPFLFAFGGLAWALLLRGRSAVKSVAASLVVAVFLLQGGGTMTFIVRSGDTWMWNNTVVRNTNRTVRSIAWSFILGKNLY